MQILQALLLDATFHRSSLLHGYTKNKATPRPLGAAPRKSIEQLHIRLESIVVLVCLVAIMTILSPFFWSVSNFLNILLATSTIGAWPSQPPSC